MLRSNLGIESLNWLYCQDLGIPHVTLPRINIFHPFILAAIRLALSQLLGANDVALIERKTEEAYYNDLNRGDVDYAVVVLVPCLIGERVSRL